MNACSPGGFPHAANIAVTILGLVLLTLFGSACSDKETATTTAGESPDEIIGRAPSPRKPADTASSPARLETSESSELDSSGRDTASARAEKPPKAKEASLSPTAEASPKIRAIIEKMDAGQLEDAFALSLEIEDPALRSQALNTLFTRWAETDPETAIETAELIEDQLAKSTAIRSAVSSWAGKSPDAAWEFITTNREPPELTTMLSGMVGRIVEMDPDKAVALADQLENPAVRSQIYQSISWSWANTDPEAAFAWIDSVDDVALNRQIRPNVLGALAEKDPEAALEFALNDTDMQSRGDSISRILRKLADVNPDAAYTVLENLDAGDLSANLKNTLGYALSKLDIDEVISSISHLGDDATSRFISSAAHSRINAGDVTEAFELVGRIPDSDERNRNYSSLATAWGHKDPLAASQWLETLPVGMPRDSAIDGFSRALLSSDPEGALVWVAAMQNEAMRAQAMRNLGRQWLRTDRSTATEWINGSDLLTAETRSYLLQIQNP